METTSTSSGLLPQQASPICVEQCEARQPAPMLQYLHLPCCVRDDGQPTHGAGVAAMHLQPASEHGVGLRESECESARRGVHAGRDAGDLRQSGGMELAGGPDQPAGRHARHRPKQPRDRYRRRMSRLRLRGFTRGIDPRIDLRTVTLTVRRLLYEAGFGGELVNDLAGNDFVPVALLPSIRARGTKMTFETAAGVSPHITVDVPFGHPNNELLFYLDADIALIAEPWLCLGTPARTKLHLRLEIAGGGLPSTARAVAGRGLGVRLRSCRQGEGAARDGERGARIYTELTRRWREAIPARSALSPFLTMNATSNDPAPRGPPDKYTTGSLLGIAETAGARVTKMRIRRPSGSARFSSTVT